MKTKSETPGDAPTKRTKAKKAVPRTVACAWCGGSVVLPDKPPLKQAVRYVTLLSSRQDNYRQTHIVQYGCSPACSSSAPDGDLRGSANPRKAGEPCLSNQ